MIVTMHAMVTKLLHYLYLINDFNYNAFNDYIIVTAVYYIRITALVMN